MKCSPPNTETSPQTSQIDILVYADGACKNNPGSGGWGSVVIHLSEHTVTELGGHEPHTTNNAMELTAAIAALDFLKNKPGTVLMITDSQYVISGMTQWIFNWKRNNWINSQGVTIVNISLWKELDALVNERRAYGLVKWQHTFGHQGVSGNEQADQIASAYAQKKPFDLYKGPLAPYPVQGVLKWQEEIDKAAQNVKNNKKNTPSKQLSQQKSQQKVFCYLSLINGVPMRHLTWPECNARVKGQPYAKFKKAHSALEEAEILSSWGIEKILPS